MGGLWGKLWWRALCAWGLVFIVSIAVRLLAIATFVMSSHANGPLDFAGGAVVHVSPLAFLVLPWLAVEGYNLCRKVPVPFGSYVAFAIVFAAILQLTSYDPDLLRPELGRGGTLFLLIVFAFACGAGLFAGWTYARLTRKKVHPEGSF